MSSLSLLLENLDLPTKVSNLINSNDNFKNESLQYLDSLFSSKSSILLNNENISTNLDSSTNSTNIITEIAELDAAQNIIEEKLKKTVIGSCNEIIDSKLKLNGILSHFETEFFHTLKDTNAMLLDIISSNSKFQSHDSYESEDMQKYAFSSPINNDFTIKQQPDALYQNVDSIIDLLELPSLAGACVKAGYYQETLEISAFTRRLAVRYNSESNIIINNIELGIKQELEEMMIGLIKLLRTDLKQSNIVKILTYLKKIFPFNVLDNNKSSARQLISNSIGNQYDRSNSPSNPDIFERNEGSQDLHMIFKCGFIDQNCESILKRIYLSSRYQFIINEFGFLSPLKDHSIEKYLKRVIELIREHCFSTVITYQSIFHEDKFMKEKQIISESDGLTREFIVNIIEAFLSILKVNLPLLKNDFASDTCDEKEKNDNIQRAKDSLILQVIYCSQSLGRIGGEFSNIILCKLQNSISKELWFKILKKQRSLIKSLK